MSGGENLVQVLQRWEHHGAQWRLVGIQNGHAAVDLCTCYGEPVDRLLLPAATTTSRSPCACHRRGLCLVEAERRQAVRGVVPGGLSLQRKRPGLLAHLRALRQGRQAVRLHTYFQAQQALANSGKRLPTNAEWQAAVAGTPHSSACKRHHVLCPEHGRQLRLRVPLLAL